MNSVCVTFGNENSLLSASKETLLLLAHCSGRYGMNNMLVLLILLYGLLLTCRGCVMCVHRVPWTGGCRWSWSNLSSMWKTRVLCGLLARAPSSCTTLWQLLGDHHLLVSNAIKIDHKLNFILFNIDLFSILYIFCGNRAKKCLKFRLFQYK